MPKLRQFVIPIGLAPVHATFRAASAPAIAPPTYGSRCVYAALPSVETRSEFLAHYAAASSRRLEQLRTRAPEWFTEEVGFVGALALLGIGRVGEVLELEVRTDGGPPLVFHGGGYRQIQAPPAAV